MIEAFSLTGYLLVLAISAGFAALSAYLGASTPIQMVIFFIAAMAFCTLVWRYKPRKKTAIDPEIDQVGGHLVGRIVQVSTFDGLHYHFTVGEEVWKGVSDTTLEIGESVKVVNINQTILKVERVN